MGSEWKKETLGNVFKVKHGFAFKGEDFTDEPQKTILVTPGNFCIGGGFNGKSLKYFKGKIPEGYVLESGQVIVTMTDLSKASDTLGFSAVVPDDDNTWLHNQRIGLLEFHEPSNFYPLYFNYLLRTHEYRSWIVGYASGTTVKHTSPSRIQSFESLLPPLPEQKAIAHILGSLDDKIELNRKMNETLEEMARAIFKSWFVDFDPVKAKAEGRKPEGMDEATAKLFPDSFEESELGMIPKGWKVESLDNIATFLNGVACQKYPATDDDSLPVLKIAELRNGISEKTDKANSQMGDEYIIRNGDVVFSWSGSLLVKIWAGDICVLNQHLFKVSSERFPKWFYYLWTLHHLAEFQAIASDKATTMGHIQRHHLRDAKVVLPNDGLLSKADTIIAPLMKTSLVIKEEAQMLANTRDTLLPKLLSGKQKISNTENILSNVV